MFLAPCLSIILPINGEINDPKAINESEMPICVRLQPNSISNGSTKCPKEYWDPPIITDEAKKHDNAMAQPLCILKFEPKRNIPLIKVKNLSGCFAQNMFKLPMILKSRMFFGPK